MRQFIRHPTNIPIEVRTHEPPVFSVCNGFNVSLGGLAVNFDSKLQLGIMVDIKIALVHPPFESQARVAWCQARSGSFDLGIEFLNPQDAFRARMVEQVCYIENYKKEVLQTQGRKLTTEEAAKEWIGKYADQFPSTH